jgi:hypothetical protein
MVPVNPTTPVAAKNLGKKTCDKRDEKEKHRKLYKKIRKLS